MPTKLRAVGSQEQELRALLNEVPDAQVVCRTRHDWPFDKARPGRVLPRGISARPQADGTALIVETCGRCGTERRYLTGAGGRLDEISTARYHHPADWVKIPREFRAGPRVFRREQFRRLEEQLSVLVARAVAQAQAEKVPVVCQGPPPVPAVKFQGGIA